VEVAKREARTEVGSYERVESCWVPVAMRKSDVPSKDCRILYLKFIRNGDL